MEKPYQYVSPAGRIYILTNDRIFYSIYLDFNAVCLLKN